MFFPVCLTTNGQWVWKDIRFGLSCVWLERFFAVDYKESVSLIYWFTFLRVSRFTCRAISVFSLFGSNVREFKSPPPVLIRPLHGIEKNIKAVSEQTQELERLTQQLLLLKQRKFSPHKNSLDTYYTMILLLIFHQRQLVTCYHNSRVKNGNVLITFNATSMWSLSAPSLCWV